MIALFYGLKASRLIPPFPLKLWAESCQRNKNRRISTQNIIKGDFFLFKREAKGVDARFSFHTIKKFAMKPPASK
jgi:hypothetical protein